MKFRKAFPGCYKKCKASENEQTIFSSNLRKYIINNKNMGSLKFLLHIYCHITNQFMNLLSFISVYKENISSPNS